MLIELKEKRVCAVCVGEPYLTEAIALDDCLIISICDYYRERVTTGSIHVSPRVVIDETKEVFLSKPPSPGAFLFLPPSEWRRNVPLGQYVKWQ